MTESSASLPAPSLSGSRPWKRTPRAEEAFKRIFDFLAAVAGLFFLLPVFLYIAYRIRRESPGPAFYFGPRVGRHGKVFKIIKFRTMYERPQSYAGPRVTAQDDPRITDYGRWLRDTKINELPQLINVIKGDMSLVGPRPEDPEIVETWEPAARHEVLSVRPGVTSPASVLYRDEEGLLTNSQVMDTYMQDIVPSKFRLDQLYVRHRSFWGDVDIIFYTLLVLMPKLRSYSPPEARLFIGPFTRFFYRYMNWFIVDTLIAFIAMVITGLLWRTTGPLDIGLGPAAALTLGFAILYSLINAVLGVNNISWSQAAAIDAIDLVPGIALATLLALGINYLYPPEMITLFSGRTDISYISWPLLPSGLIFIAAGLAYVGFVAARFRSRLVTGVATRWVKMRSISETTRERVLIVGSGETGRFAAWLLHQGRYADTYRIIGYVDDDLYKQETRILGVQVLGGRADIPRLVEKYDIGILVFAIHNISPYERRQVLDICKTTKATVLHFPDIPAALSDLAREHHANGNGGQNGQPDNRPENEYQPAGNQGDLPCLACLTKVSPLKVDGWLESIQASLACGDIIGTQREIADLRAYLRTDALKQQAANQAGANPVSQE